MRICHIITKLNLIILRKCLIIINKYIKKKNLCEDDSSYIWNICKLC